MLPHIKWSVHLLPAVLDPVEADLLASFIVPAGERCHLLVDELHDLFLRDAVRTDVVDRPPPVVPHPVVPNVSTSLPADRARPDVLLQEDEESVSYVIAFCSTQENMVMQGDVRS